MSDIHEEDIVALTGNSFAQLAVVEAVAQAIDVPTLIAKLVDEDTTLTQEEATALSVFTSTAMLALSKVVDEIAKLTDANYQEYYDKWVREQATFS